MFEISFLGHRAASDLLDGFQSGLTDQGLF